MEYDIFTLQQEMSMVLSPKRFYHSLGVAAMGVALASCYGYNTMQANVAGLLHDSAKNLKDEILLSECMKYDLPISEVETRSPYLLHGKLGAYYAKTRYQITDEEILNAIWYHTTGKPNMSLLEKIIFVADYIEPGRSPKRIPVLDNIRSCAFHNIDEAVLKILDNTLSYLKELGQEIDTMTMDAYDYYRNL